MSATRMGDGGIGLSALLAARAGVPGDALCVVRDGSEESASSSELHRAAMRIAGALATSEAAGARILLAMPPGPTWYAAFFGCLYARCIPVPVPALQGGRRLARVADVVAACGASRALCPDALADNAQRLGLRFDALEQMLQAPALAPQPVAAEDTAYLQFTSGSTGAARGAMISHRAALANLQAMQTSMQPAAGGWHACWLPLHHDMGLLMSLMSFIDGAGLALMAPEEFALEPWRWIDLVSRRRAVVSGAPNFAFEQLSRARAPAGAAIPDLSCWRTALCGAEPVRPGVMRRFARRFAANGFRAEFIKPGYGMAEFTLLASIVPPGREARSLSVSGADGMSRLVSEVGPAVPGHRLAIVDPENHRLLPDGSTGEVWLDGPSKASGYWGRAEESRALFEAQSPDLPGSFLRSGDLGLVADGSLYIVGRLKEVIILLGRNFHPSEIEDAVLAAHPALQAPAAAYAIEHGQGEQLGLCCELRRATPAAQHGEILAAVQRELSERLGLRAQRLVLLRQGSTPRTTSGKIRRLACRTLLESGELRPLAEWLADEAPPPLAAGSRPDAARIADWVSRWLAARLPLDAARLDITRPLQDFGLDSMAAVELVYALEDWLRLPIDATQLWRTATVQALAEHLAGALREPAAAPAAPGQAEASTLDHLVTSVEALSDDQVAAEFERRIRARVT